MLADNSKKLANSEAEEGYKDFPSSAPILSVVLREDEGEEGGEGGEEGTKKETVLEHCKDDDDDDDDEEEDDLLLLRAQRMGLV